RYDKETISNNVKIKLFREQALNTDKFTGSKSPSFSSKDAEIMDVNRLNVIFSNSYEMDLLNAALKKYKRRTKSVIVDTAEGLYQNKIYQ
ncbi:hypothetical protein, partial [Segetibacter aerophilus]|uniref:hypothetical protein n=1 Tax=Segetibacter aerophilus TaxID=670293 RepID=UPI001478867A